jgi:SAM-dependent methyltransferase
MNLDKDYWDQRWQHQQTGWDLGAVSPPIQAYFSMPVCQSNDPILIPGCGNAHEAEFLLNQGYSNITIIDISPTACAVLSQKFNDAIGSNKLRVLCGDFFEHHGQYQFIIEQTFFCAINPSLRSNYVIHMSKLLKPTGKLVGLLFNKQFEGGPPFGGNKEDYLKLFSEVFGCVNITACENSAQPRSGTEVWIEVSNTSV